ncbi:MAG: hypothetical protein ACK5FE_14950, partial [Cyanobacteriota bacterium]
EPRRQRRYLAEDDQGRRPPLPRETAPPQEYVGSYRSREQSDRDPRDVRNPETRNPEGRYAEDRYPEDRYSEERYPQERYPEDRFTEERFPENRYPEERYPREERPEPVRQEPGRQPLRAAHHGSSSTSGSTSLGSRSRLPSLASARSNQPPISDRRSVTADQRPSKRSEAEFTQ